jgi:hypothetical protein
MRLAMMPSKLNFSKINELDLVLLGTQTAFIFSSRFTKNLHQKPAKSTPNMDSKQLSGVGFL